MPVPDADVLFPDADTTGSVLFPDWLVTVVVPISDVDEVAVELVATAAAAAVLTTELLLPAGFFAAALKAFFAVFPFFSSTVK